MPDHVYLPSRFPPTWWDHVKVHPHDHGIALIAALFGVLLGIVAPLTGATISETAAQMLPAAVTVCGWFLLSGGIAAIVGLQWRGKNVTTGWHLEIAGWWFVGGGLAFFTGAAITTGYGLSVPLFTAILTASSLIRWWSVEKLRRTGARMVERSKEPDGGGVAT
jgi:hypothetical protein